MARSTATRVKRLHDRMGHKPAAVMCRAVNTTWHNTGVNPSDIGRVFHRQPCLTCILAKRNRDSKLIWARKRPPPQPPPGENSQPDASTPSTTATDPEEADCDIGEVISYDNVGPINPASLEGHTQFLVFRDTYSKYIFAYPIKTCNEDTFLYYLDKVLKFFKNRGFKPRILRNDYYTTFHSTKVTEYYESKGCTHQSLAPYQQWQNSVERDIQTILANVSATIHGQDWLRADTWSYALSHWTRLHNSLPHSVHNDTPARLIDNSFSIDAHHQYRFAFGDLLCFSLQEHEQLWRFDVKNDIGFYMGDADSIKGGSLVYIQYTYSTLVR
jgi:hypothetical protein